MPSVPFSDYSDTRLSADKQRCVNMYPHTKGGLRQFPGLIEFATYAGATAFSEEVELFALNTPPLSDSYYGIVEVRDGNNVYLTCDAASQTEDIVQFSLSSPYTVSTASAGGTEDINFTFDGGGWRWNADGTALIQITTAKTVQYFNVSTAYDPLTYTSRTSGGTFSWFNTNPSAAFTNTTDIKFADSGSTAYVLDRIQGRIVQFSLSDPYLPSGGTATFVASLDYTGEVPANIANRFFDISPDGKTVLVSNNTGNTVQPYSLSTAGSLSTASAGSAIDVSSQTTNPGCVRFATNTSFYLLDYTSSGGAQDLYRYRIFLNSPANERGGIKMANKAYFVLGGDLLSVDSSGATSFLGNIGGTNRCVLDTDGTQLVITEGVNKYRYTVASGLQSITDADLGEAFSNAYLDSRFYYDQDEQVKSSALNDATSINALDVVTAESFSDSVVRVLAVDQLLYFFGERSIEVWYTSGVGRPPIDRQKVVDDVGLIGRYAVSVIDNVIYFIDEQRRLNRMKSGEFETIYVPATGREWSGYATVSDVILNAYTVNQENFIEINFPSQNVAWTYHEPSGNIIEREDTTNARFNVTTYIEPFGALLGVDASNGKLYQFSGSTYQDDGSNITRTIDSALITSENYGAPGRQMIINGVEITVEASAAASMDVSIAKDGGSFSTPRTVTLASGTKSYTLRQWGRCREAIFRISTTSNAKVDFVGLAIDPEILND